MANDFATMSSYHPFMGVNGACGAIQSESNWAILRNDSFAYPLMCQPVAPLRGNEITEKIFGKKFISSS